jgi:hypothetical protein
VNNISFWLLPALFRALVDLDLRRGEPAPTASAGLDDLRAASTSGHPGRRSILRYCRCISPVPPRSSARSISLPRSSTCARRA